MPVGTLKTTDDIARRHKVEQDEWRAHQAAERVRFQQIHHNELAQTGGTSAHQVKTRHATEQNALDAQHLNEVTMLAQRHRREVATANNATKSNQKNRDREHHPDKS